MDVSTTKLSNRIWAAPNILFALICLLYVGFGLWYSLVVPPFETPDEIHHYAYARHLSQGNPLPVQLALSPEEIGDQIVPDDYADKLWAHEGSQAPLYYYLVAQLISGIDQSDFEQINTFNLRANIGNPLFPGNKNIMLYSAVSHPLQGANLALHIGRWFSLLLGLITLILTYALARMAMPGTNAAMLSLLAALLLAVIPQFVFISAALSNDSLIIVMSTATLFWLAKLLLRSEARAVSIFEWLVLGILLGLAALSKLHGLGLWLLAALTGVWIATIRRDWRVLVQAASPVAVPAVAIAGWWYWRNYTLYGDWFGLTTLLAIEGVRTDSSSIGAMMSELRGMKYSFWGLFGWFNLLLPIWVYRLIDLFTIVGLVGLAANIFEPLFFKQRTEKVNKSSSRYVQLLLLLWLLIISLILAYWLQRSIGSQGRLIFPAISSFVILLVIGLNTVFTALFRNRATKANQRAKWLYKSAWALLPLILISSSIYSLTWLFPRAYGMPATVEAIPATVQTVDATYGDDEFFQILALDVPTERYKRGDEVPVTLYMSTDTPLKNDYQLFIQFLNPQGGEVANLTSHPGWGRNPTSLWQPGVIYADTYPVRVEGPISEQSPLLARVYIGFVDPQTERSGRFPVDVVDEGGNKIEPMLATVALSAPQSDKSPPPIDAPQFGNTIQLSDASFPAQIDAVSKPFVVDLVWDVVDTPAAAYVAYVHLLNVAGERVAGTDQPPAADRMPTNYWRAGDRIQSRFVLTLPDLLPAGSYTAWVGLYKAESQGAVRVPVTEESGRMVEHNQVLIGSVRK